MARWVTPSSSRGLRRTVHKCLKVIKQRACMLSHICRMKADIVARDEREAGDRALLNLGHTFGHALEAATRLFGSASPWRRRGGGHGTGVPAISATGARARQRPQAGLRSIYARWDYPHASPKSLARGLPRNLSYHMTHDKKVSEGRLTFILVRGLGKAFATKDVPLDAVRDILAA